ncbi:MAG TPA: AlkA N-terminal domain-containing protein, partial [Thermoleophilaceae bacterium]|nr:AlkA N-terminal domain-containing protein [Thermoleophilaceae bacterium]
MRHLVDFFARRAVPGVEEADGGTYRRSLALAHGDGVLEVRSDGSTGVTLDDERDRPDAEQRLRDLLDLDTDTAPIAGALGDDPLIGGLVRAQPD